MTGDKPLLLRIQAPNWLKRLHGMLTEPAAALTQLDDRRRAYALSSALLLFLGIGMFLIVISHLFPGQFGVFQVVSVDVQIVLIVCYGLSRTRFYRFASLLALIVARVACVQMALADTTLTLLLAFIPLTTMLTGFVLDIPVLICTTVVDVVGIVTLIFVLPVLSVPMGLLMLLLTALSVVLSVGAAYVRQRESNLLRQQAHHLIESEARFRIMADTAPVMIWTTDARREYDYFNKSWVQFIGRSLEDEIANARVDGIYPEDKPRYWVAFISAFTEQASFEMMYRQRRHDGEYRWLLENASPRLLEDGTFIGYIGSCIDITDRIRAEQAAAEGEQRFRQLFEQAGDAILLLELDRRIIAANRQALKQYGYRREELIGRSATLTIVENEREAAEQTWNRLMEGEDIPSFQRTLYRKDGSTYPGEIKLALIRAMDGSPLYVQSMVRDISERRRYEQEHLELLKQNARVDVLRQFVNDASHDLRTPLSIINTSTYLVRKKLETQNAVQVVGNYLNSIDEQTQHLANVVDDMLNMSYLDSETITFTLHLMNISEVVRSLVDEMKSSNRIQQRVLRFSAPDVPVMVNADAAQLARALKCMLMNAVQYTRTDGQIQVRVSADDTAVQVEVQDDGIGISPTDLPHIFEHFYRGDSARPVNRGGAGIGLTIARKIIDLHHGEINVQSQPNVGSTFRVCVPQHRK